MIAAVLLLAACGDDPPPRPPPAPTLPVVGLLTLTEGPLAWAGQEAADSMGGLLKDRFQLRTWNVRDPETLARLQADPDVVGVVAEIPEADLDLAQRIWTTTDIPLVLSSLSTSLAIPRMLPSPADHARCAARFLAPGEEIVLVNDGSFEAVRSTEALRQVPGRRSPIVVVVTPSTLGNGATKVGTSTRGKVVYAGDPGTGADLLLTMRRLDFRNEFLGIDLYKAEFLERAAQAAEGAWVSTPDRPLLDEGLNTVFQERLGMAPSSVAVNAWDATMLLTEAWSLSSGTPTVRRESTRLLMRQIAISGAGGTLGLGENLAPTPTWCTGMEVVAGEFQPRSVARLEGDRAEVVEGADPSRKVRKPLRRGEFLKPPGPRPEPTLP